MCRQYLQSVLNGIGEVLECTNRNGLLWWILRRRIRLSQMWNDDLKGEMTCQQLTNQTEMVPARTSSEQVVTCQAGDPVNTSLICHSLNATQHINTYVQYLFREHGYLKFKCLVTKILFLSGVQLSKQLYLQATQNITVGHRVIPHIPDDTRIAQILYIS